MRFAGIKGSEEGRIKILGFGWAAGIGAVPGVSASVVPLTLGIVLFFTFLVLLLFFVASRVDLPVLRAVRGAMAIVKYSPPADPGEDATVFPLRARFLA